MKIKNFYKYEILIKNNLRKEGENKWQFGYQVII